MMAVATHWLEYVSINIQSMVAGEKEVLLFQEGLKCVFLKSEVMQCCREALLTNSTLTLHISYHFKQEYYETNGG